MQFSSPSSKCYCPGNHITNLERFIQCVTPYVPSRTLPQSCLIDLNSQWLPLGEDKIDHFNLKDVWDCYEEWSAYGAGVPVVPANSEILTQFYVPYLSAIQICSTKSVVASRSQREDNDVVESESELSCDDSGSDKLSRSLSSNSSRAWDTVSLDSNCDQPGSWPAIGHLYLEYHETDGPNNRVPFSDKIAELAKTHPAIMTLKSVDLSPASWMAVAWYPIYSIPDQKNGKNLETVFLTYHTLSSSFQDCRSDFDVIDLGKDLHFSTGWGTILGEMSKKKMSGCTSLSPFGLAAYKMQGDVWLCSSTDHRTFIDLQCAADSWLRQLNMFHHDFNYFVNRPWL